MATIYECDGCGKRSNTRASVKEIIVDIRGGEAPEKAPSTYDLCAVCERTLRRQSKPTEWPRDATAVPERLG